MQAATCDADERVTSVSWDWLRTSHDSWISKNSSVGNFMANSRTDALVLADESHAIGPWLMTPYNIPVLPEERSLNRIRKKKHVIIEHGIGQQKRFPMMHGPVLVHLQKIPSVIIAYVVMYNISRYRKGILNENYFSLCKDAYILHC